jgi:hypothetical protein
MQYDLEPQTIATIVYRKPWWRWFEKWKTAIKMQTGRHHFSSSQFESAPRRRFCPGHVLACRLHDSAKKLAQLVFSQIILTIIW